MRDNLSIDLSDLNIADVDVLAQDGKGLPEFAASCCVICLPGAQCSCSTRETKEVE